jgi:hypothetical protein
MSFNLLGTKNVDEQKNCYEYRKESFHHNPCLADRQALILKIMVQTVIPIQLLPVAYC